VSEAREHPPLPAIIKAILALERGGSMVRGKGKSKIILVLNQLSTTP
jgi:hypothetical protein